MTLRLVLFFTNGVSLQTWEKQGLFDREVELYRRLQQRGVHVSFVTYGDAGDLRFRDRLPGIDILCNRFGWPTPVYWRWLKALYAPALARAHVIKTNQIDGADVALSAARWWRKPLIARCGYMWSSLAAYHGGERLQEAEYARSLEQRVFTAANRVVVTTPVMRDYAVTEYHIPPEKVQIIPNYVDTEAFSPDERPRKPGRLCFIGRLNAEKNVLELVRACAGLDVELLMIGDGQLRSEVEETARQLKVNLQLPGFLPHNELPGPLRESELFLLVSQHEGHPKTLIEAMACGMPVIGANSPGIREVIRHGETGWLCGTDAASIRKAIETLHAQPALRATLGANARRFAVEQYSLDHIVDLEVAVLQAAAQSPGMRT